MYEGCAAQHLCCYKTIVLICLKTSPAALPVALAGPWAAPARVMDQCLALPALYPKGLLRALSHHLREEGRACNGVGLVYRSLPRIYLLVKQVWALSRNRVPQRSPPALQCVSRQAALAWAGCPPCREPGLWSPEVALTAGCSS